MASVLPLTPERFVAHCRATGFTPAEAASFFAELAALGSPMQFEPTRLRRTPWLRVLAHWHRTLRAAVLRVRTPEDWVDYCHAWSQGSFEGPTLEAGRYVAQGSARAFLFTHWPLLSLGEPEVAFERRCSGPWLEPDPTLTTWEALDHRVAHPRLLWRLLQAVDGPLPPALPTRALKGRWAQALRRTGLRSVRWHWAEPLTPIQRGALAQMLEEVQTLLAAPLGWEGPVLGLAGSTGLELMASPDGVGHGHVRLDPYATGQTLLVDDWGVIAHEWLHTLDATLARDSGQRTRYLTLALAEETTPPVAMPEVEQATDAWWRQVLRVQFEPLPPEVAQAVHAELGEWGGRMAETLGDSPALQAHLAHERACAQAGTWTVPEAEARWVTWMGTHLPEANAALAARTAQLLTQDMAVGLFPERLDADGPVWATFLREGVHGAATADVPRALRPAYLASPIELMARSFEAAYGPQTGAFQAVWRAVYATAGMIWPMPAEAHYQYAGWVACMRALEPWWAVRQRTPAPLSPLALPTRRGRALA
jgi:hypothetical protein